MITTKTRDQRELENGVTAYIARRPRGQWMIRSYERNWFEGCHLGPGGVRLGPSMFKSATVHAERMGWEELRFETEDDAFTFVEQRIAAGEAPALALA